MKISKKQKKQIGIFIILILVIMGIYLSLNDNPLTIVKIDKTTALNCDTNSDMCTIALSASGRSTEYTFSLCDNAEDCVNPSISIPTTSIKCLAYKGVYSNGMCNIGDTLKNNLNKINYIKVNDCTDSSKPPCYSSNPSPRCPFGVETINPSEIIVKNPYSCEGSLDIQFIIPLTNSNIPPNPPSDNKGIIPVVIVILLIGGIFYVYNKSKRRR